MSEPRRIGIFGGTFDPIHQTHIDIARAALAQGPLDSVLFVVAALPPHKRDEVAAAAEDRYDMVAAALAKEPGLEPSRIEIERNGPSYTVDTLARLRADDPDSVFFLILGEDSLVDFPRWHAPARILEFASLLIVPRPESHADTPQWIRDHCRYLHFAERALSSTEVRERLRAGSKLDGVVPEAVQQIIRARGLYRADC
ncbi:MAG: nicotinate (nicotinamide) nucleotide adenylyltransferase [Candidatus Hydrogenedentes bacterium]|nr:nicotinate (nicotinamide) nucleotide adenylyltransferase [Candidatus Hydrogenedentota bacterium]